MSTVLICDDDVFFTRLLKDLVTRLGHRPVTVTTGTAALQRVRTEVPALLVTDLMMKPMDGMELCRQLRAEEATSSLPVIMMSSRDAQEIRLESAGLGVVAFLAKPFDLPEMGARIRHVLDTAQQGQRAAPPAGRLAGALEELELPVLVQGLNLQRKTGCLTVEGTATAPQVKLWFVEGELHSACSTGAAGGLPALTLLAGRRTGSFVFDAHALLPPERELHMGFMDLVLLLGGD